MAAPTSNCHSQHPAQPTILPHAAMILLFAHLMQQQLTLQQQLTTLVSIMQMHPPAPPPPPPLTPMAPPITATNIAAIAVAFQALAASPNLSIPSLPTLNHCQ
eukprot:13236361-Ditylum_brightwellii.AAC.1